MNSYISICRMMLDYGDKILSNYKYINAAIVLTEHEWPQKGSAEMETDSLSYLENLSDDSKASKHLLSILLVGFSLSSLRQQTLIVKSNKQAEFQDALFHLLVFEFVKRKLQRVRPRRNFLIWVLYSLKKQTKALSDETFYPHRSVAWRKFFFLLLS